MCVYILCARASGRSLTSTHQKSEKEFVGFLVVVGYLIETNAVFRETFTTKRE